MRRHDRDERRQRGAGFTLVELLVVIAIIGLIISLILVAAADGVRRAEERATQSLITKISTGLEDRIDALLNSQAPVNQTHRYLAAINYNSSGSNYTPVGATTGSGSDERRAQVIAQFDYLRAELPDVFFITQNLPAGSDFNASAYLDYPINFAAAPYPSGGTSYQNYYLPLGDLAPGLPLDANLNLVPNNINTPNIISNPYTPPPIVGIFGASFSAIGGITKNLGYAPQGYDGVDNTSPPNGLIDELTEGVPAGTTVQAFSDQVKARLANHTHKTARAEMLYAVLVEGVGPLGSVFNRDEFTAREVQDTDNDGLPEFVDAWGEPLQFFRWPIYYGSVDGTSDSQQRGSNLYGGFTDPREIDPLDPNQLLVSPGWWSSVGNPALTTSSTFSPTFTAPNGATSESQGALAFMHYFHILVDPFQPATPNQGFGWDRTGSYARRAYFSKFLVLSSGPDKELGVAQFAKNYNDLCGGQQFPFPDKTKSMELNALSLIFVENQAAQSEPNIDPSISSYVRTGSFYEVPNLSSPTTVFLQTNVGLDDITNQNIQAPGTGVR